MPACDDPPSLSAAQLAETAEAIIHIKETLRSIAGDINEIKMMQTQIIRILMFSGLFNENQLDSLNNRS